MPDTVLDALEVASSVDHKGFVFVGADRSEVSYSFADLVAAARRRGRQLQAMGYAKGDRIGLIVPDNDEFVLTFLGALYAGVVPVPMYPPVALGKLDAYMDSLVRILGAAGARAIVTTKRVSPILWSLLDKVEALDDIVLVDKLGDAPESDEPSPEIGPEDTCFLQFTSGSTSDPKGVIVTHGSLAANANAVISDGLNADPETDRGVSWLPLYHDMGLIGFVIAPLFGLIPIVFLQTMSFVKRPTIWMEAVDRYRGTLSFAPNFAFALAAKRAAQQVESGIDLSCLRVLGCGAEPINSKTIDRFVRAFEPAGLNPNAVMPCYGMAEATLAMTFEPLDEPVLTQSIDRAAYENDNIARRVGVDSDSIELVACGRTFPGHQIGIMSPDDDLLADGEVGEIVFSGPSVTAGYYQNRSATSESFRDGWLHTGDLGFTLSGRLYVSGRLKDLIILNGRNYYPQAIEWEVEKIQGIRKGNVVAFAERGDRTERLVVVAETKAGEHGPLVEPIRAQLSAAFQLAVDDVVIVPAGSLPKTSSGKLQRRKTCAQYRDGTLGNDGVRTMGANATRAVLARHITTSAFARLRHRFRRFKQGFAAPRFGRFTAP